MRRSKLQAHQDTFVQVVRASLVTGLASGAGMCVHTSACSQGKLVGEAVYLPNDPVEQVVLELLFRWLGWALGARPSHAWQQEPEQDVT